MVVGGHLDSVHQGPGINDDGSGVSMMETAEQMDELGTSPRNKVRFIFFSGEEQGLLGSEHYVSQLTKKQIQDISVMQDYDMLASGNYARFIYDGNGDEQGSAGPKDRATSSRSTRTGTTARAWRTRRSRSTGAPTTTLSLMSGSRQAASSPAPRSPRPSSRWRCTAAPLDSPSIPLPPAVRHAGQHQRAGPRGAQGRRGPRDPDIRSDDRVRARYGPGLDDSNEGLGLEGRQARPLAPRHQDDSMRRPAPAGAPIISVARCTR